MIQHTKNTLFNICLTLMCLGFFFFGWWLGNDCSFERGVGHDRADQKTVYNPKFPHTVFSSQNFEITKFVDVNGDEKHVPSGIGKCYSASFSEISDCCQISSGAKIFKIKNIDNTSVLYQVKNQDVSQPKACPFENFYIVNDYMTNMTNMTNMIEKDSLASERKKAIVSAIKGNN